MCVTRAPVSSTVRLFMELVEKLLFIHDSQIEKWGRLNGFFSLVTGLVFICSSPLLYVLALSGIKEIEIRFVNLGNKIDQDFGLELSVAFSSLETTLACIATLFTLLGLMFIIAALLTLKLHKRLHDKKA